MKYKPTGVKVLIKQLPIEQGKVEVPDHLKSAMGTGKQQFFSIIDLGPAAVDEQHPFEIGQTVMISTHPTMLVGVDAVERLLVCNNKDIAVICVSDDVPAITLN